MLRGQGAFLARLTIAELAERSLDAQYYVWHVDAPDLLLEALGPEQVAHAVARLHDAQRAAQG